MPHSNSARKRLRQNEKRRNDNRSRESEMKTYIKRVMKAVEQGDVEAAKKELPLAMKKIDKVAQKNIIHRNQASRKIGRLSRKVAAMQQKAKPKDQAPGSAT